MDNREEVVKMGMGKAFKFCFDPNTGISTLFEGKECKKIWKLGLDASHKKALKIVYGVL